MARFGRPQNSSGGTNYERGSCRKSLIYIQMGPATLLCYGDKKKEVYGGEALTTNNRMELMAAIQGLEVLTRPCKVKITTDSQYVRKGVLEWMANWKKRHWLTAAKQPVKNKDLWQRLDKVLVDHTVAWHWVKGHSAQDH